MRNKLICLFLSIYFFTSFLPEGCTSVDEEGILLKIELGLAEQAENYIIFNLSEKRIFLKAKGIVIQEWPMVSMRFIGDPIPLNRLLLRGKITSNPPKRIEIKPQQMEVKGEFQLDAQEVDDMPDTYTLVIDQGFTISIRPSLKGYSSFIEGLLSSTRWHIVQPLYLLYHSYKKKPYTLIDITLADKKEAQTLFWAFTEQMPCIIVQ